MYMYICQIPKWKICSFGKKNEYLKKCSSVSTCIATKAPAGLKLGMYGSQVGHFIHSAME